MKRALPILMGFALLLLSSTEGWSADFQTGYKAYQAKDYVTAFNELKPLAEAGHECAQYYLADTYIKTKDQKEAFKDADFVYAKNWSSYKNYGQISKGKDDWIVNKEKMDLTNDAKFMHCLPIRRNIVASDEVLDNKNSLVIKQAENRIYSAQYIIEKLLKNE